MSDIYRLAIGLPALVVGHVLGMPCRREDGVVAIVPKEHGVAVVVLPLLVVAVLQGNGARAGGAADLSGGRLCRLDWWKVHVTHCGRVHSSELGTALRKREVTPVRVVIGVPEGTWQAGPAG